MASQVEEYWDAVRALSLNLSLFTTVVMPSSYLQVKEQRGETRPDSESSETDSLKPTVISESKRTSGANLMSLTVSEIKIVLKKEGINYRALQCIEKSELVNALKNIRGSFNTAFISEAECIPSEAVKIESFNMLTLKLLLNEREIPYYDCLERQELVQRVQDTHKGICERLPDAVLRDMLAKWGLPQDPIVPHADLVRRVMAMRALRAHQKKAAEQREGATLLSPEGSRQQYLRRGGGDAGSSDDDEDGGKCNCACAVQ